jgi:hypothetical protein
VINQIRAIAKQYEINEGSALAFTITLYTDGTLTVPTSLRYRVDCITTGATLTSWTSLTPASTTSVTVTPAANAIQNNSNFTEVKTITLEADHGLSGAYTHETTWRVKNLQGIT